MNWKVLLSFAAIVCLCPQFAASQMEKRKDALYRLERFVQSSPVIGEHALSVAVKTLDGKPVSLSDYRGTNLVIIKGSYT